MEQRETQATPVHTDMQSGVCQQVCAGSEHTQPLTRTRLWPVAPAPNQTPDRTPPWSPGPGLLQWQEAWRVGVCGVGSRGESWGP